MVRTERIVRESDIVHEIKTYNELLGDEGGVGSTLLIEINNVTKETNSLKSGFPPKTSVPCFGKWAKNLRRI